MEEEGGKIYGGGPQVLIKYVLAMAYVRGRILNLLLNLYKMYLTLKCTFGYEINCTNNLRIKILCFRSEIERK